jgi:hypothetical protein
MSVQAQLFNTCVAQIGIVKLYAFKSERTDVGGNRERA